MKKEEKKINLSKHRELICFMLLGIHALTVTLITALIKAFDVPNIQRGFGVFSLIAFVLCVLLWFISGIIASSGYRAVAVGVLFTCMSSLLWYLFAGFYPVTIQNLFAISFGSMFLFAAFSFVFSDQIFQQTDRDEDEETEDTSS